MIMHELACWISYCRKFWEVWGCLKFLKLLLYILHNIWDYLAKFHEFWRFSKRVMKFWRKLSCFWIRIKELCINEVVWSLDILMSSGVDVMQIFGKSGESWKSHLWSREVGWTNYVSKGIYWEIMDIHVKKYIKNFVRLIMEWLLRILAKVRLL